MLDYISKQLKARMHANDPDPIQEEAQMDTAILECAHLFQELDDLSIEGTEAGSSRPFTKVDIPLEDDIEITSVEMNMLDGRVTDIPADATVQESDYSRMKTFDDFYQEAYQTTTQFARETDNEFRDRIESIASQRLAAYKNYCIQEGLFGFDKFSVNDNRVPSRITLDFGKHKGKDYSVKLIVKFEVDAKNRILKKQLDSILAIQSDKMFEEGIQDTAFKAFGQRLGIDSAESIWDKVTPVEIVVPVDPADKYCAAIGFELDGVDTLSYIEWIAPMKNKESKGIDHAIQYEGKGAELTNATDAKIRKLHTMTKGEAIKQEAAILEMRSRHRAPNRFYQEAIDFGNPEEAPASDPNATGVSFDAAPAADGADQPTGDAPAADGGTDAPEAGDTENKELVDTNNVSDQIAEKISDETQNDANNEGDISVDGIDTGTDADVSDVDTSDTPSDEEINADLGDEGTPVEDTGETSDLDFDNMTIDELMAQGQAKMKTMTMQQLKDFLQNGETAESEVAPDADVTDTTQEAFFLTRGNIGKELDIHLRKALGILNSSDMEIEELCKEFKREGKKLNRVVHKASKMKDVFNEKECIQLVKLNHCLADLMGMLRADIDSGSVMTVKRMIQAFVSEATGVVKMLEKRKEEPVQE